MNKRSGAAPHCTAHLAAMLISTVPMIVSGTTAAIGQEWTGSASTDWFDGNNWNGSAVPDGSVDAIIDTTTPNSTSVTDQSANGTANASDLFVGNVGNGTLTVSNGGAVSNTYGYIGRNSGSVGTAEVSGAGSTWINSGDLFVGTDGHGTLTVADGGAVSNAYGTIGFSSSSVGTANVRGAGSTWTNSINLYVGYSGNGALTVAAGGAVSNLRGFIGRLSSSVGTVEVSGVGSTWTNSDSLTVGHDGDGTLTISDGGAVSNTTGYIGRNSGSVGAAEVSGAGSTWINSGDLFVGTDGHGTLTVADGGAVSNAYGTIGFSSSSVGTANVRGAGSTWTNSAFLTVGEDGDGTLKVSNGGAVSNTHGSIGDNIGSVGTAEVSGSGSTWTNSYDLYVGNGGQGTLTVADGGAVNVAGITYLARNSNAKGRVNIGAATGETARAAGTLNTSRIEFGDGEATLVFNHTGQTGSYQFNADLVSSGTGTHAIVHEAGWTSLTGDNSGYTGTTDINGGTLSVDGNLGGTVNVKTGGTLAGSGTLSGQMAVNAGATLAPGNSIGTIATGNLTLAGTYEVEFDNDGNADLIDVTGTVDITGSTLKLVALGDTGALPIHTSHTIIRNDGTDAVTGTFASGTGLNTTGDLFSAANTAGGDGNDVDIDIYRTSITLADGATNTETVAFPGSFPDFTFNVASSDSATFSGSLSEGSSSVNVTKSGGGTLTMTGNNSVSGTMTIGGGALVNNGTLAGGVVVENGAVYGGTGTSRTLTVKAGGTLAPGNSIGTIRATDTVTFNTGSTYEVEIDTAGNSDRIATTGTATINGGTVTVSGVSGTNTTYAILTADGGVTGKFDALTGLTDTLFVTNTLSYDTNAVYLHASQAAFCDFAGTGNQSAVACGGLDSLASSSDLAQAVMALATADEVRAAYDALSGQVHSSLKGVLTENSQHNVTAVNNRLHTILANTDGQASTATHGNVSSLAADPNGFWTTGYGSWSNGGATGNTAKIESSLGGWVIGFDRQVGDIWLLGTLGGYSHTEAKQKTLSSSGSADTWSLGLYGGLETGASTVSFGGLHNWHSIETTRTASFTGFSENLAASYDARSWQLFAEAGHKVQIDSLMLKPFAGVSHINLQTDGYSETGGSAALSASSDTQHTTFTTLGVRSAYQLLNRFQAQGMVGWRHAFGDTDPTSVLAFSGSDPFTVTGAPIADDAFVGKLGLEGSLSDTAFINASYNGQYGDNTTEHGFNLNFTVKF
ncbi:autotransporter domain-containing protein [Roseibium sp. SCP14]|uniref:autotransporter domain-containing protein n=1 Tax=Roseibium sp. SCP14 TaxID=3141375 RepID=UPI003336EDDA